MKLSLVVPCYNEEQNIAPLFKKIQGEFQNKIDSYELVFVNDGSTDGTLDALKQLCDATETPVKIVNFSRNFGKEAAIFAGLKNASGDLISLIDADLQQDPAYVVKMVEYLAEHSDCDCVAAFQEKRNESAFRTFCKKHFYHVINKMSDTEFVDGASDFRTFRSTMKEAILEMSEYHRFSKGIFSWVGFNTYYMPYEANERLAGSSKWSFKKLCQYAIDGIVAFTTVPLKISTSIGFLTSLASLIYIIIVIIEKLAFGIAVPGYATIVVLILFLGGLQLLALGINGEYLSRTYIQSKHRPIYIAREVISNKDDKNDI